jgi:molecular chaperone GrpE
MIARMDRVEILRRFEKLLDESLAAEEPPRGIDAELLAITEDRDDADRQCDSYALWAAMTGLTQEVKLQGRAFKELNDTIGRQAERLSEEPAGVYREREVQREAERRSRRDILGALVDLRDRLGRGLESAIAASDGIAHRTRWLERLLRKRSDVATATLDALKKGYQLSLERLDQMLEEFNAREIRCKGERFDPHRMNAIDLEESDAVPDGTVLEVYRNGYEWNGEVFRPAQVKVSRGRAAVNQT